MAMWNRRQAKQRYRPQAAGFTLLEVVVAVAIVALLLVPLLHLHILSMDAIIRSQDLTTAVLLTQGRLAAMGPFPEAGEEEGSYEEPELAKFKWQTTVTEHKFDTEGGTSVAVRHIAVTVTWADGQQEHHYSLESYASQ
jgi:general secretion pathway protein I